MSGPVPTPGPTAYCLRFPCADIEQAFKFARFLLGEGVDTDGTDGHFVLVPTSYPPFAWDIAQIGVDKGFAHDSEATDAVLAFLKEAGR